MRPMYAHFVDTVDNALDLPQPTTRFLTRQIDRVLRVCCTVVYENVAENGKQVERVGDRYTQDKRANRVDVRASDRVEERSVLRASDSGKPP